MVQTNSANSLRQIAKGGAKVFYEGEIVQKIVAEMVRHNGLITLDDMKAYQAIERKPVMSLYRGCEIVAISSANSAGQHFIQVLNMLENYPLVEVLK